MKRKYALLLLALFALSGCSSDKGRGGRAPIEPEGGNTGQPVESVYYSHITDSISDIDFTWKIAEFIAVPGSDPTDPYGSQSASEVYPDELGIVKARTESNKEGMRVRINLGLTNNQFASWDDVNPSEMELQIIIYDEYTYPVGQGLGEGLAPYILTFPKGLGSLQDASSGEKRIVFTDATGSVWFTGSLNGNEFTGRMHFDNNGYYNYSGALGNFKFPKCGLTSDGCK